MKFIKPKVELLIQENGLKGIYRQIEKVGRTCYKSENKITENSAKPFVERIVKSKHLSVCEHGTVYLTILEKDFDNESFPYSRVEYSNGIFYITTNYRVLLENNLTKYLCYITTPTEYHTQRICLKFTTSIGVSREFNRHRTFSIAEQSTRYCNYSKDKFGGEISYILPSWIFKDELRNLGTAEHAYYKALQTAEQQYMSLTTRLGMQPQQAREVLPLSTATEVVYTGFVDDWKHFFDLRYRGTTGAPHPDAKLIATAAHDLIEYKLNLNL